MRLYVSKNGQRYGPYSLEELRREVLANVFRPEHFASSDSGRTWEPISSVPGIGRSSMRSKQTSRRIC